MTVPREALSECNGEQAVMVVSYKSLPGLHSERILNGIAKVSSNVLTVTVGVRPSVGRFELASPATFQFTIDPDLKEEATCTWYNFDKAVWDPSGCTLVERTDTYIRCVCAPKHQQKKKKKERKWGGGGGGRGH